MQDFVPWREFSAIEKRLYLGFIAKRRVPLPPKIIEAGRLAWKTVACKVQERHGEAAFWDFVDYARENTLSLLYKRKFPAVSNGD